MSYIPNDGNVDNAPGSIPNYLVWNIVLTVLSLPLFCIYCTGFPAMITGIIAIVFSAQVNSKLALGDVQGALSSSKTAKIMVWVTSGLLVIGILAATLIILAILSAAGGSEAFMEEVRREMQNAR